MKIELNFVFLQFVLSVMQFRLGETGSHECQRLKIASEISTKPCMIEREGFSQDVYLKLSPSFKNITFNVKLDPSSESPTLSDWPLEITATELKRFSKEAWLHMRVEVKKFRRYYTGWRFSMVAVLDNGVEFLGDEGTIWQLEEKEIMTVFIGGGVEISFSCLPTNNSTLILCNNEELLGVESRNASIDSGELALKSVQQTNELTNVYIGTSSGLVLMLISAFIVFCAFFRKRKATRIIQCESQDQDNSHSTDCLGQYHTPESCQPNSCSSQLEDSGLEVSNGLHDVPLSDNNACCANPNYDIAPSNKFSFFTRKSKSTDRNANSSLYDRPGQFCKWVSGKFRGQTDNIYDKPPAPMQVENINDPRDSSEIYVNMDCQTQEIVYDVPGRNQREFTQPEGYPSNPNQFTDISWERNPNLQGQFRDNEPDLIYSNIEPSNSINQYQEPVDQHIYSNVPAPRKNYPGSETNLPSHQVNIYDRPRQINHDSQMHVMTSDNFNCVVDEMVDSPYDIPPINYCVSKSDGKYTNQYNSVNQNYGLRGQEFYYQNAQY